MTETRTAELAELETANLAEINGLIMDYANVTREMREKEVFEEDDEISDRYCSVMNMTYEYVDRYPITMSLQMYRLLPFDRYFEYYYGLSQPMNKMPFVFDVNSCEQVSGISFLAKEMQDIGTYHGDFSDDDLDELLYAFVKWDIVSFDEYRKIQSNLDFIKWEHSKLGNKLLDEADEKEYQEDVKRLGLMMYSYC